MAEVAEIVGGMLQERGLSLATAESCTGGMIGELITAVPGSSAYYVGGVIAYSNEVKAALLGVPAEVLAEHGAVSGAVAEAMAQGIMERTASDVAVTTTGIAGPGGGTPDKPVGLVFIGLARRGERAVSRRFVFSGNRKDIRLVASHTALEMVQSLFVS
jgi:PncC family amidohydrolase